MIKIIPFFATRRYNPRISFNLVNIIIALTRERLIIIKVIDISKRIEATIEATRYFIK